MRESFQRLFMMSGSDVLSLNAQAARGPVKEPERSQFSHLVRHFLARFFNHEMASPDGDAKARLVLIAVTTGLPGFVVALYLWPVYHPLLGWPQNDANGGRPPYWLEVNHHLFYVVYSFVAVGIATVFEWDMFFPDRLDLFVLQTLPIAKGRMFAARVSAIAILIGGFLFGANILATLALAIVADPPNLHCFLAGHLLAVASSGLFAAAFILALQGVLISALGERLFRRLSLFMQVLTITALLMLLLLFPVLSGAVPVFLQSGSAYALCSPPLWFLGIYQRLLEGSSALPIYAKLAKTGCVALMVTAVLASSRIQSHTCAECANWLKTRVLATPVTGSAVPLIVFSMLRWCGLLCVGQSSTSSVKRCCGCRVTASILFSMEGSAFRSLPSPFFVWRMYISRFGWKSHLTEFALRSELWLSGRLLGLRMAFVSPGNWQGSWVFRSVHGRPAPFRAAMDQLLAVKTWALLWGLIISFGGCMALRVIAPPEPRALRATASQLLVAAGMSMLLADIFFLNVKTVPFTGERTREQSNLAIAVLKYIAFVPAVAWLPLISEPWIEARTEHFILAVVAIAATHLVFCMQHRAIIREHCNMPGLEEDEEEFPLKLGLRY